MGTVVSFPEGGSVSGRLTAGERREPATVIILPVIRIERYDETPTSDVQSSTSTTRRRRRRRRSS